MPIFSENESIRLTNRIESIPIDSNIANWNALMGWTDWARKEVSISWGSCTGENRNEISPRNWQHAQQVWRCSDMLFLRYASGQTCRQTDRQTDRHADRNISHSFRGRGQITVSALTECDRILVREVNRSVVQTSLNDIARPNKF